MTPDNPTPAPAPSRHNPRWLLTGLLLALALGGWATAYYALTRKEPPAPQLRPGAVVVFHVATLAPTLLQENAQPVGDFRSYCAVQAALLRNRRTLDAALKQPGVADLGVVKAQADPVAWLAENLQVSFQGELMRVEIDGEPVGELVAVLGAVAKVFLAEVDARDNGARRTRLAKLEETQRAYLADGERFHKRLDTIAMALGSKDARTLAVKDSLMAEELQAALRELTVVRQQIALFEPNSAEAKKLAVRETAAKARAAELEKEISKNNDYRTELDNIRQLMEQSNKMQMRITEELERLKIELGAPSRVGLLEEPAPRRAR